MTVLEATKSKNSLGVTRSGRLFVLEASGNRVLSLNPDGSDRKVIAVSDPLFHGLAAVSD